eukprot:9588691-Karenia_brevis.AAC.1
MQKELEPRDKWLGIKELKQQFTPKMYERAHWNDDNVMCQKRDQAEQTALYLIQQDSDGYYVHSEDIYHKFNLGRITAKEVKEAIKTMSNNKASGTDGTTIEILKCLNEDNLEEIAEVLNMYWADEKVPEELTHAR